MLGLVCLTAPLFPLIYNLSQPIFVADPSFLVSSLGISLISQELGIGLELQLYWLFQLERQNLYH